MNHIHLIATLLQFILHLQSIPLATAGIYGSDDKHFSHSQLTFSPEGQSLVASPDPRHRTAQDGSASQFATFDPLEDLRHALGVMQGTWFRVWVGTWPTAIDWTRAVMDTYLVSALSTLSKALYTGADCNDARSKQIENEINQYFTQNIAYYFGENALSLRNQAYDDMLWVVLEWLESIKFIKAHSRLHFAPIPEESSSKKAQQWHGSQFIEVFAHRTRVFYEITTRGWDTELCGGGMTWSPYLGPYKNAITNELYIAASVGMYLYFPGDNNSSPFMVDGIHGFNLKPVPPFEPRYLQAAIDGYDWLKHSNMTNEQGLYVDGFHVSNWKTNGTKCDARNNMVYTYNQGVLLSGLRSLWEATGNRSYLDDGHELARNVMNATGWLFETARPPDKHEWAGIGRSGILEERCDASGHCDQNGQTFKGIFFHHLTLFCEPLPLKPAAPGKTHCASKELACLHSQSCKQYGKWVEHNARAALSSRDENGRFGMWWAARNDVESEPLPVGAVDYRNDVSELLKPLWKLHDDPDWSSTVERYGDGQVLDTRGRVQSHGLIAQHLGRRSSYEPRHDPGINSDLNDRGRGRTVETQGGGVAVLRALWELNNIT